MENAGKTAGDVVVDRVKAALGVQQDTELAALLGSSTTKGNIQQVRRRGGGTVVYRMLDAILQRIEATAPKPAD